MSPCSRGARTRLRVQRASDGLSQAGAVGVQGLHAASSQALRRDREETGAARHAAHEPAIAQPMRPQPTIPTLNSCGSCTRAMIPSRARTRVHPQAAGQARVQPLAAATGTVLAPAFLAGFPTYWSPIGSFPSSPLVLKILVCSGTAGLAVDLGSRASKSSIAIHSLSGSAG